MADAGIFGVLAIISGAWIGCWGALTSCGSNGASTVGALIPGSLGAAGMSPNAASMFTPGILFNISIKPLMACLKMLTMPSQAALAMLDHGYWEAGVEVTVISPEGLERRGIISDLPMSSD